MNLSHHCLIYLIQFPSANYKYNNKYININTNLKMLIIKPLNFCLSSQYLSIHHHMRIVIDEASSKISKQSLFIRNTAFCYFGLLSTCTC